jgi:peptidase M28-like protein
VPLMRRALVRIVAACCVSVGAWMFSSSALGAASSRLDAANDAWERGDFVGALTSYIQLLNGPQGDAMLEPIARRTGEVFRTDELTADGRNGRFAADSRYIVYEIGLESSRRTRVLRNDAERAVVADLPGISATFSSDGARVAYLKVVETAEVKKAAQALDAATLTQSDRSLLVQTLTWQIARDSVIAVRDVTSGHEIDLPTPVMVKSSLTYAADGRTLYFLGAKDDNDTRTDIYKISETSDGPTLAVDAAGLKSAPLVDPGGAVLVYTVPTVSPLRRPGAASAPRPAGPARPPSTFGIADVSARRVSVVTGTAPALSGDGRTLAYVARDGAEYTLMVGPATGLQTAVFRTAMRIDAPALTEDGARIAWQMMPRDDWEIFVAEVAGSSLRDQRRVTREIQHDVLPRFISRDRLIAMVGEPRHRRSYLYDLTAPDPIEPTRLFHNNSVRTIAPEYQWAPSAGGSQLIVGAERDGDTVSPARGVYLLDLAQRVSNADVLARLRAGLKSETALRAAGTRAFRPIAADVKQVLAKTSVNRIYGYEKALFDFDSKNISRPGNARAAAFLFETYKSFGYEPEYQWFEPSTPQRPAGGAAASPAEATRTANIVATLRGTVNPELVYVVSSHYDSVAGGPGADDDSSGTAALLEAARVLAGHPLPATVVFASMTGEEAGLLGSKEFVRRAVENKIHVAAVLNNDMIGWTNDQRMDNTIRYSNPGIRDIQHAAAMQFTRLITYDALYWKGTDAMSFYDAYGDIIGGIGSYPVLGSPYYHQPNDVLENENHQLIAETSKTTVATIMLLASSPSRLTNLRVDSYTADAAVPRGRDAGTAVLSWTPSPEKGVASYIVAYGPPSAPLSHRVTVTQPRASLPQVAPGTVVSVKAVNARGLEGWDWARISVGAVKTARPHLTQGSHPQG